jgi:pimeloyl-ACP methyl ester carboxylesterase
MKKILKGILKVLLVIVCIIVIFAGVIFCLRLYNDHKYGSAESLTDIDVTDISQYPTELDGIEVRIVDNGAFQGFHLIPDNKQSKGVIVCYGGSDGSPFFEVAQSYAEKGYETLSVFMFGMKNQPKELTRVPLEQFSDVLDYIDKNIEDNYPITIVGASKGAEYVLNLAARYNEISNVMLFAPVAYSFSGLNFDAVSAASSWTWQGEEVPYVDIQKASFSALFKDMLFPMMIGSPMNFRGIYSAALEADPQRDEKLIPVQKIKGDILILVGEDDGMMDTLSMAELIKSKSANTVIYSYENAGHMFSGDGIASEFGMRMRLGGTIEGNEKARVESGKMVEEFLKAHHGE